MNSFDAFYFSRFVTEGDTIKKVFHRHIFLILEEIILWLFFGLVIPAFLYGNNILDIQSNLPIMYVYAYIVLLYVLIIYKVFDWYADVWIATNTSVIALDWKWFTPNLVYVGNDKIEGIEVRTKSWFNSMIGMSDLVMKLSGQDHFVLTSAASPKTVVEYVQEMTSGHGHADEDNRKPFEILVDTLSDVVKNQIETRGKEYINEEYIEKLDTTLAHGKPIDLRNSEEKKIVETWKKRNKKKDEDAESEGGHGH